MKKGGGSGGSGDSPHSREKTEDKATKDDWNEGHRVLAKRFGAPEATKVRRLSAANMEVHPKDTEDRPRMVLCGVVVLAVILLAAVSAFILQMKVLQ